MINCIRNLGTFERKGPQVCSPLQLDWIGRPKSARSTSRIFKEKHTKKNEVWGAVTLGIHQRKDVLEKKCS